jgi:hypothetical protein
LPYRYMGKRLHRTFDLLLRGWRSLDAAWRARSFAITLRWMEFGSPATL